MKDNFESIKRELIYLGANGYNTLLPEAHVLPEILHGDEKLRGIVFGKYEQTGAQPARGRGALIVTDQRIMLLDKKPLFVKCDEISFEVVSGISFSWVVIAGTILLHTRMGDIKMHTFNHNAARHFVEAVETSGLRAA